MLDTLHNLTIDNMNAINELKSKLNNSSMTMKEYQLVRGQLNLLDNLASDMVSLSKTLKEKE